MLVVDVGIETVVAADGVVVDVHPEDLLRAAACAAKACCLMNALCAACSFRSAHRFCPSNATC